LRIANALIRVIYKFCGDNMAKFRVIFEKRVKAYLDIEAENKSEVKAKQEDLFSENWERDSFNYPDSDWQIKHIEEMKEP